MIFKGSLELRPIIDNQTGILRAEANWGYIVGNNTPRVTTSVAFATAFSAAPLVFATFLGASVPEPTLISDLTVGYGNTYSTGIAVTDITANGFIVELHYSDGANFGSSGYYGFSWYAIGQT